MEILTFTHGERVFRYTDHTISLPAPVTNLLKNILKRWQIVFPKEDTLIQARHGVPSLFVRFDCSISQDGTVHIYEIQDGCGGVGYAGIANKASAQVRDQVISREWPDLSVVTSKHIRTEIDDELWTPRILVDKALKSSYPLIIRNPLLQRSNEERSLLFKRSVCPVLTHNNKEYGVDFGWWKIVRWEESLNENTLPWNEPFVLKPQDGHGSKDVMFWRPGKHSARATRTQILRVLQDRKVMYQQPLIQPSQMIINGALCNYILRPFFVYSSHQKQWVPMHGVWTARPSPNMRIHGASDAVSGPLFMEQ